MIEGILLTPDWGRFWGQSSMALLVPDQQRFTKRSGVLTGSDTVQYRTRSSATAEKQRGSCAYVPRLAN